MHPSGKVGLWSVPFDLLCTIVNMHNGMMTKPALPHAILGKALTRNLVTTWSGLKGHLVLPHPFLAQCT